MSGYAQQLLIERGFDLKIKNQDAGLKWPFLFSCISLKILPFVDYALAASLLKNAVCQDEALAALLCHLSLSSRCGHLCVSICDGTVSPTPQDVWLQSEENEACIDGDALSIYFERVEALLLKGAALASSINVIRRFENLFYLQRFWAFEEIVISSLKRLLETKPAIEMESSLVQTKTAELLSCKILLKEQIKAIISTSNSCLTLLTGGPGTGKTHTAGQLIKCLWNSLSLDAHADYQIAIAAPTGKAAANLQASLQRSTQGIPHFPKLNASTLHSLLGVKGPTSIFDPQKKLSADLILVDESSMIDVRLMAYLLSSIKPGARLILLGDPYQLPSVDAGGIFSDLIKIFKEMDSPSLVELKTCMRAENLELISFADAVKAGNSIAANNLVQDEGTDYPITRLVLSEKNFQNDLLEYALKYFKKDKGSGLGELLKAFNDFRILTPFRKGPYGVEAINALFVNGLKDWIFPILITQNDYKLDLYNGETGILIQEGGDSYAVFPPRDNKEAFRKFSSALLPNYEYAYCMSIHKSQGCEFNRVLMLVPEGSEKFGREVFYTGATRARQRLEIWGSDDAINKTINSLSVRLSGMREKIFAG